MDANQILGSPAIRRASGHRPTALALLFGSRAEEEVGK